MTLSSQTTRPELPETGAAGAGDAGDPAARQRTGPHAWLQAAWRPLAAIGGALVVFVVFAWTQGTSPADLTDAIVSGVVNNPNFGQQALVRAVPLILAALAVVIPARAGLVNVGGEGQLIVGAVAATGLGVAIGATVPGPLTWLLCAGLGALAGALWALICAALRVWGRAPEAVTTLLMNFIALDIMLFLLYQSWRDPDGSGQPQSRPLDAAAMLPSIPGTRVSIAIVVVLAVAAGVWWLLNRTNWGFALKVAGGNPTAGTRAGLSIRSLSLGSMALGGALAGLGGALNLLGVEGQLRPGVTTTFGFIAFLAAFVVRGHAARAVVVATLFAAAVVAGNPLQLRAGLDGSAVYVLLGLLCLGLVALTRPRRRTT